MKAKMNKFGITVLTCVMLLSPTAFANRGGDHGYGYGGGFETKFFHKAHMILYYGEQLGLSEKQLEEVRNLKFDVKKTLIRQDADIEITGLDVKRLMKANSIDVEAVHKLIDQKYELKKAKSKYLVESIATLKQSLSQEQWQKMKDLKAAKHGSAEKMGKKN